MSGVLLAILGAVHVRKVAGRHYRWLEGSECFGSLVGSGGAKDRDGKLGVVDGSQRRGWMDMHRLHGADHERSWRLLYNWIKMCIVFFMFSQCR